MFLFLNLCIPPRAQVNDVRTRCPKYLLDKRYERTPQGREAGEGLEAAKVAEEAGLEACSLPLPLLLAPRFVAGGVA